MLYNKIKILLIALIPGSFSLFGQAGETLILSAEELNGGEITKSGVYKGSSLWGYMNGGADIYLEYGFESLQVMEIRYDGNDYKIEIFLMDDPESAFGKFSVSKFHCNTNETTITKHFCETIYQVQFARGNNYVSITNQSGDESGMKYNRHLASGILSKTGENAYVIPPLFQNDLFRDFRKELKLIKGNLGLQNGFAFWSDRFDGLKNFKILVLPIETEEGNMNLATIEFPDPDERKKFCALNNLHNPDDEESGYNESPASLYFSWNLGETGLILLESTVSAVDTDKYFRTIRDFLEKRE